MKSIVSLTALALALSACAAGPASIEASDMEEATGVAVLDQDQSSVNQLVLDPKLDQDQVALSSQVDPNDPDLGSLVLVGVINKGDQGKVYLSLMEIGGTAGISQVQCGYQLIIHDLLNGGATIKGATPSPSGQFQLDTSAFPACDPFQGILGIEANLNGRSSGELLIDNTCVQQSQPDVPPGANPVKPSAGGVKSSVLANILAHARARKAAHH